MTCKCSLDVGGYLGICSSLEDPARFRRWKSIKAPDASWGLSAKGRGGSLGRCTCKCSNLAFETTGTSTKPLEDNVEFELCSRSEVEEERKCSAAVRDEASDPSVSERVDRGL